jgi:hypothetical protein
MILLKPITSNQVHVKYITNEKKTYNIFVLESVNKLLNMQFEACYILPTILYHLYNNN